jgi:hypothetical protein
MPADPSAQYWTTSATESPTAIDYVGSGYGGAVTDGVTTSSPMQQNAFTTFGSNGGAGPSTSWNMSFEENYDASEYSLVTFLFLSNLILEKASVGLPHYSKKNVC